MMPALEQPALSQELRDVKARVSENVQAPGAFGGLADDREYSDPEIDDGNDQLLDESVPHPSLDPVSDAILRAAIREQKDLTAAFLDAQSSVLPPHREVAIKWLIQLNHALGFVPDTVYNAVMFFDIVAMRTPIDDADSYVYAAVCYFLAVKIDNKTRPSIETVNSLTGQSFTNSQFLRKEVEILQTLRFRLSYPTIGFFLRVFLEGLKLDDNIASLAAFFADVGLIKCRVLHFESLTIALAAIVLSSAGLGFNDLALDAIAIAHHKKPDALVQCIGLLRVEWEAVLKDWSHPARHAILGTLSAVNLQLDFHTLISYSKQ